MHPLWSKNARGEMTSPCLKSSQPGCDRRGEIQQLEMNWFLKALRRVPVVPPHLQPHSSPPGPVEVLPGWENSQLVLCPGLEQRHIMIMIYVDFLGVQTMRYHEISAYPLTYIYIFNGCQCWVIFQIPTSPCVTVKFFPPHWRTDRLNPDTRSPSIRAIMLHHHVCKLNPYYCLSDISNCHWWEYWITVFSN